VEVLVIGILISKYILDTSLTLLNLRYKSNPVPKNVKDLYEPERYDKWMRYTHMNTRFDLVKSGVDLIVLLSLLMGGGALIQVLNSVAQTSPNGLMQTLIFLGLYQAISFVVGLGYSYYRTFVIEEKFGFNKTTVKVFISDYIKQVVLTIVVGGSLVSGLYYLFVAFQDQLLNFVIVLWLSVMVLLAILVYLYTTLFVKVFYKIEPLEEGELRNRVEALANQMDFKVKSISKLDASKRTSKMNAFFSGFGKRREIVFYDTLLEKLDTDEILSVLVHEFAHGKNKDQLKGFIERFFIVGLFAIFIFWVLTTPSLYTAFGFDDIFLGFGIILFSVLASPIYFILDIPLMASSRKAEYKADALAASIMGSTATAGAIKIMAKDALSDLNPHPLIVKLYYSHPPTHLRLAAIET
jgi:STE24 endopeptidase